MYFKKLLRVELCKLEGKGVRADQFMLYLIVLSVVVLAEAVLGASINIARGHAVTGYIPDER